MLIVLYVDFLLGFKLLNKFNKVKLSILHFWSTPSGLKNPTCYNIFWLFLLLKEFFLYMLIKTVILVPYYYLLLLKNEISLICNSNYS